MDKRNYDNISEEEIDLKKFFLTLYRNKKLILKFSISGLIIGLLIAFSSKKVWQGEFQIVLESNSNELPVNIDSRLAEIAGIGIKAPNDTLKTEVGILKSPSVLLKVFEFLKNEKVLNGDKSLEKQGFRKWMESESVKINLIKKTSILEVSYKDKDKNLILPTLNKIANVYQDYSGKKTRRKLQLTKLYLNKQIKEFKEKSFNSIKLAQEYALDQDLTMLDINTERESFGKFNIDPNFNQFQNFSSSANIQNNQLGNTISIEVARVKAANDIKRIDLQIKKIKELDSTSENLQFISIIVPAVENEGLPQDLRELDLQIIELSSKYTEKFIPLINLKKQKIILINALKERAIGFLEAEKLLAQATMESAKRPKGVLLKYKELIREAKRDEKTLIQLENSLRSIELEESKIEDPWELITEPTLKDTPVAPKFINYALFGIIIGSITGMILSFIKEKRTNLVYEAKELESILSAKIIEQINLNELNLKNKLKETFLEDLFILSKDKKTQFFVSSNLKNSLLNEIKKKICKNNNSSFITEINNLNNNEATILLTSIPLIKYDELYSIKKRLDIKNIKLLGIFLI